MRLALSVLLLSAVLHAQEGSVEGVVTNKATGQPLSGVQIHFLTGDFAGSNGGISGAYGALSDQAGHYSVGGMKPGLYLVLLERPGFVQMQTSGAIPVAMVTIKAGETVTGHKFEMIPRALIAGRVVDEYGDPVEHSQVRVDPLEPNTQAGSPFGPTNASTDDRGEFRLIVAPGKYFLQAQPAFGANRVPEIRTDGTAPPSYSATYYPNSPNKTSAAAIEVTAGQDLAGLEIRLARGTASGVGARPSTISGMVSGIPEGSRATILLRGENDSGFLPRTTVSQDGKFTIGGLQPGLYGLLAAAQGTKPLQSQMLEIRLAGADETNIQLSLTAAPEISGTLEFSGVVSTSKRTVRLEPAGFVAYGVEMTGGDADPKGAFTIGNVPPGKYRVRVEPLPDNAYVKAVTLDGTAVSDVTLDLTRGVKGNRIKVSISMSGGQISGKLVDKDGKPVVGPLVFVFLATDIKHLQDENAQRSADGTYAVKAIRPGKYRIMALDVFQLASVMAGPQDEKALEPIFNLAEDIEVKEGDRIVKDLKVIDKMPGKEGPDGK
jgi:hypothetical protein